MLGQALAAASTKEKPPTESSALAPLASGPELRLNQNLVVISGSAKALKTSEMSLRITSC